MQLKLKAGTTQFARKLLVAAAIVGLAPLAAQARGVAAPVVIVQTPNGPVVKVIVTPPAPIVTTPSCSKGGGNGVSPC